MAQNVLEMKKEWIVIGISGVTCGGKTTLAKKLKAIITPVHLFHQDKYFYSDDSPKHIKCDGLAHNNYDILSALDMDKMYADVLKTMSGEDASHQSHKERKAGHIEAENKKFLIIEGFTVLNFKPLLELCDLRYYFVLEYGECAARRCHRLYEPPDVDGYFEACVWPQHIRYRAEIEKDKRVVLLDGARHDALDVVLADIKALGAREIA